jgi:tetratricopeptide (TPR) repeat protein
VSAPLYFEGFRTALARVATGLIRPGGPAPEAAIAAAEKALGRPLPASYAAFLRTFDGADLFNESLVVCGVGPEAERNLVEANQPPLPALARPGELIVAEAVTGDRYVLGAGEEPPVVHLRVGSDERWLAGSSFPAWLEAVVAREQLLYDSEGEFRLEAFEEDGEELTVPFALRQAERALKKDPGSAESHHDLGLAYRRLERLDRARAAFEQAAALDPENPWPSFDRARTELLLEDPAAAAASFREAARRLPGAEGARFLAWAARAARAAGREEEAAAAREEALLRDPDLPASLRRAAEAAMAEDDQEARLEAEHLAEAISPPKRRLPLVD